MWTWNRLDLQTLGSPPLIMPKKLRDLCTENCFIICMFCVTSLLNAKKWESLTYECCSLRTNAASEFECENSAPKSSCLKISRACGPQIETSCWCLHLYQLRVKEMWQMCIVLIWNCVMSLHSNFQDSKNSSPTYTHSKFIEKSIVAFIHIIY